MNEQDWSWDDLRTVLGIARAGSLSGAARQLGVSHATVFRRLGAIETRLGVQLFDRQRTGYQPTPAGEDMARAAERIESEVAGVQRRVAGRDRQPAGTLRVTTTDTLLQGLLSPVLAGFRAAYPEISLEVAVSNLLFNLTRREADIAVRPTASPPEHLVGRRIGRIAQAVYGAGALYAPGGTSTYPETAPWVGPDESMAYRQLDAWMDARDLGPACHYRVDTLQGMHCAVRDGTGIAVLPCYLGDMDGTLVRLSAPLPEMATELWLLTHRDLRRTARIRVFMTHVAAAVREREDLLSGVSSTSD